MTRQSYVLCEWNKVKEVFPEFNSVAESLANRLISRGEDDWSPKSYGGIAPTAGQFGKTTVMPQLFQDISGNALTTWNQDLDATGHQTIIQGVNAGGVIPEDYKIGLLGIRFLDKALKVSEIKMQISDRKLPRVNVEEAFMYNQPSIVFEDGYILDEETGFHLYGYVISEGHQRIQLLGVQLNRVPNKLQVTDTGAALA